MKTQIKKWRVKQLKAILKFNKSDYIFYKRNIKLIKGLL